MKDKSNVFTTKSTSELFSMIQASPEQFASTMKRDDMFQNTLTVSDYLEKLLDEHNMSIPDLVVKTNLSKSFVYQIFSGERNPGRDILFRIAFAMHLSVDEVQEVLMIGQKGALYPKVRRDAALLCCLEQKLSLDEADEFLKSISEKGLL